MIKTYYKYHIIMPIPDGIISVCALCAIIVAVYTSQHVVFSACERKRTHPESAIVQLPVNHMLRH